MSGVVAGDAKDTKDLPPPTNGSDIVRPIPIAGVAVPFFQRVTSLDDDENARFGLTDPSDPFEVRPSSPLSPRLDAAAAVTTGGDSKIPPFSGGGGGGGGGAAAVPIAPPPLTLSDSFIVQLTTHQTKPANPLPPTSDEEWDVLTQLLGRAPNEYPTKPVDTTNTTNVQSTEPLIPPLVSLNLSHHNLDDAKLIRLCGGGGGGGGRTGLAANRTLTSLRLCSNRLTDKGINALSAALSSQRGLIALDLYRNYMTEDGLVSLSTQLLRDHSTLQFLSLNNNSVGSKRGVNALAAAMKHNSSLISLSLTQIGLTGEVLGPLSLALTTNRTLRNLNLSTNSLDVNCCNALRILLESVHSVLEVLDVSSCRLTSDAMKILAQGLASPHCNLITFAAGSNEIGSDGIGHVVQALIKNRGSTKLQSLIVFRNRIGEAGGKILGSFLTTGHSRLTFLHIGMWCGVVVMWPSPD